MHQQISFGVVWGYRAAILDGLLVTLQISAISLVFGLIIGFVVSNARQATNPILRFTAAAYVEIFRGTPVLVQLFWFFFCLPVIFGFEIANTTSAVLVLSLYTGALSSESFRAALRSIEREQHDACIALGLSFRVKVLHVILPQTILRAVPNLLTNIVTLFKQSALVSALGIADLMYRGQNVAESTARPIEVLTTVALIYFVIAFVVTRIVSASERRILEKYSV